MGAVMQVIIYKGADGEFVAVSPSAGAVSRDGVEAVAARVVPDGASWRAVAASELPAAPSRKWSVADDVLRDWSRPFVVNVAPPDPEQVRAGIDAERDRRLKVIAGNYTQTERETWPVQVKEATALQSDPAADTPMLRGIVGPDGDVSALAARVLALSAAFAAATGAIMGAATRLKAMDPLPEDYTDDKWWP